MLFNFAFFSTDLDLTLPGGVNSEQRAGTSTANQQGAIIFRPASRIQNPVFIEPTLNRANFLLNTINEENEEHRFLNNSVTSSTPFPSRPAVERSQQSEEGQSTQNLSIIDEDTIIETPKRLTKGRLSRRLSNDAEPTIEDRSDDDDDEKENKNDAPDAFQDCVVDVVKLRPSDGTMETFKEHFAQVEQTRNESQATNETHDNQSIISESINSSKLVRKRNSKVVVPRRSTERPKRKARLEVTSMAEVKLNQKMRRN